MVGKHKDPLLGWHAPAELAAWARGEAERRGVHLSVILTEALSDFRRKLTRTKSETEETEQ